MSEKHARAAFRDAVKAADQAAHVVQVENGVAGPGTPDSYVRSRGRSAWFEVKFVHPPKRPDTPLRLDHYRQGQMVWAGREWAAGGRSWVVLFVAAPVGRYYYLHPRTALEIKMRRWTVDALGHEAVWSGRVLDGLYVVQNLLR